MSNRQSSCLRIIIQLKIFDTAISFKFYIYHVTSFLLRITPNDLSTSGFCWLFYGFTFQQHNVLCISLRLPKTKISNLCDLFPSTEHPASCDMCFYSFQMCGSFITFFFLVELQMIFKTRKLKYLFCSSKVVCLN